MAGEAMATPFFCLSTVLQVGQLIDRQGFKVLQEWR